MPVFGHDSRNNLQSVHRDLRVLCNVAIQLYDFSVVEGHRGEERQNQLLTADPPKTFLAWPESKHNSNPSMAVDLAPYPIDWGNHKRFYFLAGVLFSVAWLLNLVGIMRHELRWGGDWDRDQDFGDQEFHDLGHFELVEIDDW